MARLTINGAPVEIDAPADTPLLIVIREHLGLTGSKYGCGAAMCGSCTVHVDGAATYACITTLGDVEGAEIVTIEGLSPGGDHPLQRAWIAEQAPQCGYCQSGQIMRAAALLNENPNPSRDEIVDAMSGNLCRCGTYARIVRAIQRATQEA
ncbi:MAG: (2Fe-2S)-binding protein [Alphaproteobacteria bacterium]|nr:(2Fe-2S)-binding protein [Alphaproteobacteria bacterium]